MVTVKADSIVLKANYFMNDDYKISYYMPKWGNSAWQFDRYYYNGLVD